MERHRVLVVDDSPTSRALISEVLAADVDIAVVGQVADGAAALEATKRLRPSIIVMDINMPVMDGFEATKRIMIEEPTPIVVVTAGYDPEQVEISLKAVGAGALSVARKPSGPRAPEFRADASRLVTLVKALSDVKVIRRRRDGSPPDAAVPAASRGLEAVGVAASTGGPAALYRFLEVLPRTLAVPVLVVQHIADGFIEGLVRWLSAATVLPVSEATDGVHLGGGEIYVAPDDRHLTVKGGRIKLSTDEPVGGFRPSANVLFESLARAYGTGAAVVVLTGMGDDGLLGASAVREAGGMVLAQDAGSSAVFGMPNAVTSAGLATAVGPVEDLASRIARIASKRSE